MSSPNLSLDLTLSDLEKFRKFRTVSYSPLCIPDSNVLRYMW